MTRTATERQNYIFSAALCLLVAVLAIAIYGQSHRFGRAMDDHLVFDVMESVPDDISGLSVIFRSRYNISDYRPVTMASFQIERMVTGRLTPGQAHIINPNPSLEFKNRR